VFSGCSNARAVQKKLSVNEFAYTENIKYSKSELTITDTEPNEPTGITSDKSHLYICDSGNDRIIVCDFDGKIVTEFGKTGSNFGEFDYPNFVSVNETHICVHDKGNNRLQIFDKNSDNTADFVREYSLDEQFEFPFEITDIAFDNSGEIFLSVMVSKEKDADRSGIYVINNDDKLVKIKDMSVGKFGKNNDNNIIFTSTYEYSDKKWISGYAEMLLINGEEVTRKVGFANDTYSALSVASYGDEIYVYNDCTMSLDVFSPEFVYKETVFSEEVKPENDFRYADFCTDNAGNFFFTDILGGKIYELYN
jgi:DNA-binding beta-propeller fold protein YncE